MFGTTEIAGGGNDAGQTPKVWFKNENHVSRLNGKPWICSPDLLTLVHRESGEATINTNIAEGDEVVGVGMKGFEAFRSDFGLNESTGPRYFGFDIDYVPIEKLIDYV